MSRVRYSRFLYSALSRCMPSDVQAFFEAEGVPLKTERGRRVFPQSDRALDIVDALMQEMKKHGTEIRLHANVRRLLLSDGIPAGDSGELLQLLEDLGS